MKTDLISTIQKSNDYIKNISSIFSEIDDRILTLHKCSSDDFLSFNEKLKQYHSAVCSINVNSDEILNIIDSDKTSDFFTQLNFFHFQIKKYVESFEEMIDNRIGMLENLLKQINLMYLPLKNYKQNLITLKYLIANTKLNMAYTSLNDTFVLDKEIEEIYETVINLTNIFPPFEEGLEELKSNIYLAILSFKKFRDNSSLNSSMILHQTDYSLNLLNVKHSGIVSHVNILREKTATCSNNVNKIIINLQFHDIIRQKIEHIQSTNQSIIQDIAKSYELKEGEINPSIHKIKEVAELQIAQLTHTNQKYQNAIDTIIQQFSDIADNLYSSLSKFHSFDMVDNNSQYEMPFSDIEKELLNGIKIVKNLTSAIDNFHDKVNVINNSVSNLNTFNTQLSKGREDLTNSLKKFLIKNNNKELREMLIVLIAYIKNNDNFNKHLDSLNEAFSNISNTTNKLTRISDDNAFFPDLKNVLIKTGDKINHLVFELIKTNNEILDKLISNHQSCYNVINDIKLAVSQVKYYDYFERVMEHEVIAKLNTLYNDFKNKYNPDSEDNNSDFLNNFQNLYTMRSERIIHDNITNKKNIDVNSHDDNVESKVDADDVEFF